MYLPILLAWTWLLLLSTIHASPLPKVDRSLNDPSRLNGFVHTSSTEFDGDSSNLFKRTDDKGKTIKEEPGETDGSKSPQQNPTTPASSGPADLHRVARNVFKFGQGSQFVVGSTKSGPPPSYTLPKLVPYRKAGSSSSHSQAREDRSGMSDAFG